MSALLDEALQGVLEAVWPTRCAVCETLDELLCSDCLAKLPFIEQRWACPRCGAPFGWLVCSECLTTEGSADLPYGGGVSALEFRDGAVRLIVAYKDKDERRLAGILAGLLADALPRGWLAWADAFCWIPCDVVAYRRRGFDHMSELAEHLAERAGRPALPLLYKEQVADQRGLDRRQREENIRASFHANRDAVAGLLARNPQAHVVLLDDVCTTGATLAAAAEVLLAAGIGEVRVATVARVG